MNHVEAANASTHKMAYRNSDEIYDLTSNSFMSLSYLNNQYIAKRRIRGHTKSDAWNPITNGEMATAINIFKACDEGRDTTILNPWRDAINESPLNIAYRKFPNAPFILVRSVDNDGKINTWKEYSKGQFTLVEGVFREYDGWMPMNLYHVFADYAFMDGSRSYLSMSKTAELECDERPQKKLEEVKADVPPKIVTTPKLKDIPIELIMASAEITKAIASIVPLVDETERKELTDVIRRIANNVSWLMKEDREFWLAKNRS